MKASQIVWQEVEFKGVKFYIPINDLSKSKEQHTIDGYNKIIKYHKNNPKNI